MRPHPHILTHGNNGAIPAEWHHWDGSNCSATWHKEPYGVELYRWAGGPLACLWGLVARSLGVVSLTRRPSSDPALSSHEDEQFYPLDFDATENENIVSDPQYAKVRPERPAPVVVAAAAVVWLCEC